MNLSHHKLTKKQIARLNFQNHQIESIDFTQLETSCGNDFFTVLYIKLCMI
jgi:hypothetical protein